MLRRLLTAIHDQLEAGEFPADGIFDFSPQKAKGESKKQLYECTIQGASRREGQGTEPLAKFVSTPCAFYISVCFT